MAVNLDDIIIYWYGKNIIQDANNRLVTDVQIDYWNKKSDPNHTHDERYYTETEMNTFLNNKSNIDHTHDNRYYTEGEIDDKLKNISNSIPTSMSWESITGKPSTYPPSSHNHDTVYSKLGHTHTKSDITDLQAALNGKADSHHNHPISDITNLQTALDGKALVSHTHKIADITNLQATLDNKSGVNHNHDTVYSKLGHTHDDRYYTETEINNLLKGISGDVAAITWNTLVGKPDTFPPSSHNHTIATITGLKTILDTKSSVGHNHDDTYSKLGHNHDERYYTETEMDSKIKDINDDINSINWQTLTGKPDTFPPSSHTHDDRYYTETEMDAKLNSKSNTGHTHDERYYTETEMNNKLKTKSDTGHTHDDRYYTEGEIDDKLKNITSNVTSINWNTLTGKPSTFPPSSHTHDERYYTEAEIDDKLKAINGSISAISWSTLTGKPDTFTPSAHTHVIANITGLQDALNGKAASNHNHDTVYSKLGHTHDDRYYTESEIDSKLKDLSMGVSYINWSTLEGKPSTFPPSSHTHTISNITNLQSTLDGKASSTHNHDTVYSKLGHVHTWDSITGDSKPLINRKQSPSGSWFTQVSDDLEVEGDLESQGDVYVRTHFRLYGLESEVTGSNDVLIKLPAKSGTIALTSDLVPFDNYLPLSGGTMTGIINKQQGGSWIGARDNVLVSGGPTSNNNWGPVVGVNTSNGFWSIGNLGSNENLTFSYTTDTDYGASNNVATSVNLPNKAGTLALVSDITWDRVKVAYPTFTGINLDTNGAYIYGQNNSGNIYFRYKKNASDTDYAWANVRDIVTAINGKAASNHTHSNYLPLTGGTLNNGSTQCPLVITGAANNESSITFKYKTQTSGGHWVIGEGCGTQDLNSFAFYQNGKGVIARLNNDGQWRCSKLVLSGYQNKDDPQDLVGITANEYTVRFRGGVDGYFMTKGPSSLCFGYDNDMTIEGDAGIHDYGYTFRMQMKFCYCDVGLRSSGVYDTTTTTDSANVFIDKKYGTFKRVSSAAKYKLNIESLSDPNKCYNILRVNPRQWFDKGDVERYSKYLASEYSGEKIRKEEKEYCLESSLNQCYGLIAEDVQEAGLPEFCTYGEEKEDGTAELEGVKYDRLPILMIPILRDLVSCMSKILPYAKKGIDDEATLKEVEEIEKRFNLFNDTDVVDLQYDPQTSAIVK